MAGGSCDRGRVADGSAGAAGEGPPPRHPPNLTTTVRLTGGLWKESEALRQADKRVFVALKILFRSRESQAEELVVAQTVQGGFAEFNDFSIPGFQRQ